MIDQLIIDGQRLFAVSQDIDGADQARVEIILRSLASRYSRRYGGWFLSRPAQKRLEILLAVNAAAYRNTSGKACWLYVIPGARRALPIVPAVALAKRRLHHAATA
jgi:hypothetical protein